MENELKNVVNNSLDQICTDKLADFKDSVRPIIFTNIDKGRSSHLTEANEIDEKALRSYVDRVVENFEANRTYIQQLQTDKLPTFGNNLSRTSSFLSLVNYCVNTVATKLTIYPKKSGPNI